MLDVGLTGGIGSGKSTVASLLASHGAVVIDADALAREALAPGTRALAAVVDALGPGLLDAAGALDRPALARRVFTDADALRRLEAIVHPVVAQLTVERRAQVPAGSVVVHDIPLLVEAGLAGRYDLVVVVDAPDDVRLQRLVDRGVSRDDAQARMAAQATREQRLAAADVVIDNSDGLDRLVEQVTALWQRLSTTDPRQPGTPGPGVGGDA